MWNGNLTLQEWVLPHLHEQYSSGAEQNAARMPRHHGIETNLVESNTRYRTCTCIYIQTRQCFNNGAIFDSNPTLDFMMYNVLVERAF